MSTVPEAIMANQLGTRNLLAISCVTNVAAAVLNEKINHDHVLEIGHQVREIFVHLLKAVIPKLNTGVT